MLVGPWTATLCLTVVLAVQALLFADGGITALGTNITLMAIVGVWAGWLVFVALRRLARSAGVKAVPALAGVAAFVSVPVTALAFTALYAVGGRAPIPLGELVTAMVGWHTVIGIGEGIITLLAVGSIIATRPDLVHGARGLVQSRQLEIRTGAHA